MFDTFHACSQDADNLRQSMLACFAISISHNVSSTFREILLVSVSLKQSIQSLHSPFVGEIF